MVAESAPPSVVPGAAYAEQVYAAASQNYLKAPTNAVTAWQYGRACFDRAEFATNSAERATLAEQGIGACRKALAQQPNSAPAHYYLAMNLGQLARTRTLSALRLVNEMETAFKAARGLDERVNFAGPDRNLGRLYLEAPGWPTSIGNRSKARLHLRRAAELVPDYPENRLNLVEAYLQWGDRNAAARELKEVEALWPIAAANLTGEEWVAAWADWQARLKRVTKELEAEVRTQSSPRQRQ